MEALMASGMGSREAEAGEPDPSTPDAMDISEGGIKVRVHILWP